MRIIPGIISGQGFEAVFTGDPSLSRRPMRRIIEPLRAMGATIEGDNGTDHAPLRVKGRYPLTCGDHNINVASAQVKSCILSAGLYAGGVTSVTEPFRSRDHTERMLKYFSADIKVEGLKVSVRGQKELVSKDICVPGDISSAAFFIVAGLIVDGPGILLRNVGINETRRGVIDVLKRMGADIEIRDVRGELEPVCDLFVKRSELKGTVVRKEEIPLLIDEIPVLTVAASVASGETVINDIGELKVKETDRVKSMMHNLAIAGASSREEGSSLIIEGGTRSFRAAKFESFGDHRTAMSMAIAALISEGESLIADTACVGTSYPRFLADLERITTK
jgi:3-phosphoshikimate 1-carboxyvinyltransferase